MSDARTSSEIERPGMKPWLKKTITVVATLLVLVITYFVLAAFLPRWWAQRIAGLAEGGFSRGILWGLLFGILCTAIPLVLLVWVWQVRGWKFGRGVQIALTVLALVVAIPNLMTLSVVLGGGNAAHAGERIMDVDAPGFRGASLVGAVIGVLVFVLLVVTTVRYRKRGKDLRAARADLERKASETGGRDVDSVGDTGVVEGLPPEDSSRGPVDR
jgi:uncharacterized membrane protein (DUF485 family)